MSEQEMEKGLNYGDSVNFVGRIADLLQGAFEKVEKNIDKLLKNQ